MEAKRDVSMPARGLTRATAAAAVLLAALLACSLVPGLGGGGQGQPAAATPTPTPTPTAMPLGQGPVTPGPAGQALAMEFTLEGAAGWATLTGSLHSCSGLAGPWTGQLQLYYNDSMNWNCSGATTMDFSVPPGANSVEGEVTFDLVCQAVEPECVVDAAAEVTAYRIDFETEGSQAVITMGSTGAGSVTETCYYPNQPPETVSLPRMAFFFGENTIAVPLQPYDGCP